MGNGHFLNLDMSLSCFVSIAMLAFVHAQHPQATPRECAVRMRLMWLAIALGVMSKGPIAIVLPALAIGLAVLIERRWALLKRMAWTEGTIIVLGICAPWFLAMEVQHPGFLHFFFVREHFERFTTETHQRTGGWYYFIPVLAAGSQPWIGLLPGAIRNALRQRESGLNIDRLALLWALVVFLFFSASRSKLSSYVLPMFPPQALLIARYVESMSGQRLMRHLLGFVVAFTSLVVIAAFIAEPLAAMLRSSTSSEAIAAYRPWVLGSVAVLVLATIGLAAHRRDALSSVSIFAVAWPVTIQIALASFQFLSRERSTRIMLASIGDQIDPHRPFYSVAAYDQALPFYLGRPVMLVAYEDEFKFGLEFEPRHAVPTLEQFAEVWSDQHGAAAMMNLSTFDAFRARGLPMKLLWKDRRRVVVKSP